MQFEIDEDAFHSISWHFAIHVILIKEEVWLMMMMKMQLMGIKDL